MKKLFTVVLIASLAQAKDASQRKPKKVPLNEFVQRVEKAAQAPFVTFPYHAVKSSFNAKNITDDLLKEHLDKKSRDTDNSKSPRERLILANAQLSKRNSITSVIENISWSALIGSAIGFSARNGAQYAKSAATMNTKNIFVSSTVEQSDWRNLLIGAGIGIGYTALSHLSMSIMQYQINDIIKPKEEK